MISCDEAEMDSGGIGEHMAFEGLSDKLQGVFKKLKGKGVLTEADINEAMREVKLALLEADVNFKVVKEFVATVKEKSLGADVLESLTPAQQVCKRHRHKASASFRSSSDNWPAYRRSWSYQYPVTPPSSER